MSKITTTHKANAIVAPQEWGCLTWYTSEAQGNSATMTIGRCEILPGQSNPRHQHPNCEEVLHVLQGAISHTDNNGEVVLTAGDTITVPAGIIHNARNIGEDTAILAIAFSSANRLTVGE